MSLRKTIKKNKAVSIVLSLIAIIIIAAFSYGFWLSRHYKQIIMARLPQMIQRSTDSVYSMSFTDVDVSFYKHTITVSDLKLWPDMQQVAVLKQQHRHTPPTLSTAFIPLLEAYGMDWKALLSNKSLDCNDIIVHNIKWQMDCHPNPADSLYMMDKKGTPKISRFSALQVHFIDPDITYNYTGAKEKFSCYMKGGTALLKDWAYNYDQEKDTTTFLYAHSGDVRLNNFILDKPTGHYVIKKTGLDFETNADKVILRSIKIKHMVDTDPQTKKEKEIYNFNFPSIELAGFNWNRLINSGELIIPKLSAEKPDIDIHYIRENDPNYGKEGSYPNQLLLEVGLKTNIEQLNIRNGHLTYNEVTKKGDEGTIEFAAIQGSFSNITNMPAAIAHNKSCIVKLNGSFMNKSPLSVNFDLSLSDKKGGFKVDGYVKDLNGNDVSQPASIFTIVKVTSFHLQRMDMHIEGDGTYSKGDFTVLYENLKISLFKFDTKMREGKHGPLAFVGSALVLYPSNPMPGKDVRKVSTSFARDTSRGFISGIWQHMYRAAKKTSVREQELVTMTDGPETDKGEQPKKGFFKRLFGKRKKE